jgi:putative heme-binding domain-containing protein
MVPFRRFTIAALIVAVASVSLAEDAPPVLSILTQQLAKTDDSNLQLNLLRGMNAALKGRRGVTPPPEWKAVAAKLAQSPNQEIRDLLQSLGTVFGSSDAFASLRKTAVDDKADVSARKKALEALVNGKDAETAPLLKKLIEKPGPLRADAIRGLATFGEKETVEYLMGFYDGFNPEERQAALGTAAARQEWARSIGWVIDRGGVPKKDISVPLIRQLRNYKDEALDRILDRHFGKMAGGSADKQAEIAKFKQWITAEFVNAGNASKGREVYSRTCALCHKLFDAGMEIGPELTGSNRTDIDYLLQNIVDPNALIGEDYQLNTVELKDGRMLAGMVKGHDENTLTLRTMTEQVTVPSPDVKTKTVSPMSMMPEGLLGALPREDVQNLFKYLASPTQVPLP